MKTKEIKKLRYDLGKFLHSYYVKFGEEKYEKFLDRFGPVLESEYGEPFSSDNLRIMEAEFVTFNSKIHERKQKADKENTKQ